MPTSLYFLLIVFLAAISVQIIYFILYLVALSKQQPTREPSILPVSVIVCAHDEEINLKQLIPLLLGQHYPAFEVVVVNDRSNDSTFDFLLAEAAKDHRLRMVHVNRTPPHADSKKYALTLGIKAARYEWLLFTDSDCRPSGTGWISSISSHFGDKTDFVLGFSPYFKLPGFLNLFIRFETILTGLQYISFALLNMPYMGVGRNLAYRRSQFLEGKGFNNILNITGGDDDLYVNQNAKKGNTQVCLDAEGVVNSYPKTTWKEFSRQKIRHLSVGKRYKFGHRLALGLFMISWILSWFTGILLLALQTSITLVSVLLVVRIIGLSIVMANASKKLHQKFETGMVPLLDFIYAFYYLVTGLRALATKKVKWKN